MPSAETLTASTVIKNFSVLSRHWCITGSLRSPVVVTKPSSQLYWEKTMLVGRGNNFFQNTLYSSKRNIQALKSSVEATDFKAKYELSMPAQFNLCWFVFTFLPNCWLVVGEKVNRNNNLKIPFLKAHLVHLLYGSFFYLSLLSSAFTPALHQL